MWDVGLASMFKERDNKGSIGACVGKVVDISPLQIDISNGDITLQEDQLYVCDSVLDGYTRDCKINNGTAGTITFIDTLKVNDEVLILPTESFRMFFIVNKVTKLGGE